MFPVRSVTYVPGLYPVLRSPPPLSGTFVPQDLLGSLRAAGDIQVLQEAAGTLTVILRTVPTSFFHYDYPLLRPLQRSPWDLHVAILKTLRR